MVVAPFPAIAPGLITQFPDGKPPRTTDPVDIAQVGCVIVPIVGFPGDAGCALTVKLATGEVQPFPFCAEIV